jgi:hypothetical protein
MSAEDIEQIKKLIISEYNAYATENNGVDRVFFEGNKLKSKCIESLKIIYPILFSGRQYDLSTSDFEEKFSIAVKEVRFKYKTVMNPSMSIQNEYKDTWLTQERIDELGWDNKVEFRTYRTRYLKYLKTIGRSESVILETERTSLEIIKKIGDPKNSDNYFVKGLVVGSVQSGKTSNFNAVVNSSIDVGYRLIIVLSGVMEDLRRQTQIRTEKEVEGRMVARDTFLGVGEIASFGIQGIHSEVNQIVIPTSRDKDFNRNMRDSDFSLNQVNILICKKNTSVLQNLLLWLKEYLLENNDKHDLPFLIIDDEADNASINNLGHKGKDFSNKINGHIRALLALFNRKTYIGYTATPFANILQDWNKEPDKKWIVKDSRNNIESKFDQVGNLFPDDFIELLFPPSNYIGPKNFFTTKTEEFKKIDLLLAKPLIDNIKFFPERLEIATLDGVKKYSNQTEFDEDHNAISRFDSYQDYKVETRATTKYDDFPLAIPKSLDEAIKCFIIAIAIRLTRRPQLIQSTLFHPHNTMLIHVSRFSDWQCKTKGLIVELVNEIRYKLNNDRLSSEDSIFKEFERIWIKYFAETINNINEYLPENYKDEYLVKKSFLEVRDFLIAAIEGIEVKAVNTVAKDALDYENGEKKYIVIGGNKLSRGFTLEGLTINYFVRNTSFADTLLQMGRWFGYRPGYIDCCKLFTTQDTFDKFDQCTETIEELEEEFKKLSKNRKKPKDFAIKVLTHPGTLKITRPSILKNAVVEKWSYEDSLEQTTEFHLTKEKIESSWENFKEVYKEHSDKFKEDPRKFLLLNANTEVLSQFLKSQSTYTEKFDYKSIIRYIKLCNKYKKLINWTIAIKTSGSLDYLLKENTGFLVDVQLKKLSTPENPENRFYTKLKDDSIFRASGNSSNIVTSGKDFSLLLTEKQIVKVRENFKNDNKQKKNPGEPPEKYYRKMYNDTEGLVVIYIMDLKEIFNSDELREKAKNEQIDINTPLIGFALGIPPLKANIGGDYLVNKHILDNIKNNPDPEEIEDDDGDIEEFEGIESEL